MCFLEVGFGCHNKVGWPLDLVGTIPNWIVLQMAFTSTKNNNKGEQENLQ